MKEIKVIAAIEGNGSRPSHRGMGINDGKVMYTLNSVEVHGVVCSNDILFDAYNSEVTGGYPKH
jgi:hypothetical protein